MIITSIFNASLHPDIPVMKASKRFSQHFCYSHKDSNFIKGVMTDELAVVCDWIPDSKLSVSFVQAKTKYLLFPENVARLNIGYNSEKNYTS